MIASQKRSFFSQALLLLLMRQSKGDIIIFKNILNFVIDSVTYIRNLKVEKFSDRSPHQAAVDLLLSFAGVDRLSVVSVDAQNVLKKFYLFFSVFLFCATFLYSLYFVSCDVNFGRGGYKADLKLTNIFCLAFFLKKLNCLDIAIFSNHETEIEQTQRVFFG